MQNSKKALLSRIWKKRVLSLMQNYKFIIPFFALFVNQISMFFSDRCDGKMLILKQKKKQTMFILTNAVCF